MMEELEPWIELRGAMLREEKLEQAGSPDSRFAEALA
jgi:hypothetical protein